MVHFRINTCAIRFPRYMCTFIGKSEVGLSDCETQSNRTELKIRYDVSFCGGNTHLTMRNHNS